MRNIPGQQTYQQACECPGQESKGGGGKASSIPAKAGGSGSGKGGGNGGAKGGSGKSAPSRMSGFIRNGACVCAPTGGTGRTGLKAKK